MNLSRVSSVVGLLLASFSFFSPVRADQHQPYSDDQIQGIILHDLSESKIEGVTVGVQDGVVTLRGTVRSAWEHDRALEIARGVHDVSDVRDELTVERGESDKSLGFRLGATIENSIFYSMFDAVSGTVRQGVVTLTGWVTTPYASAELAKAAAKVPGVTEVKNQIQVLPASPFDDELRSRLASAIYANLPELATGRVPPIHIIVNNGRVTLVGIVNSKMERFQAEQAARGVFGVFRVDNQLQVEAS